MQPERGVCHDVDEDAARPAGDQRSEQRVLQRSHDHLDAGGTICCTRTAVISLPKRAAKSA